MKRFIPLFFCLLVAGSSLFSQVAINPNGNAPNPSAMLDISSLNRGLLIPRMTLADMQAIVEPATGLLVYNTNNQALYNYNGSAWNMIKAKPSSSILDADGNTAVDVEYYPNANLIYFRLDGQTRFLFHNDCIEFSNPNKNISLGAFAGSNNTTGLYNIAIGEWALYANAGGDYNVAIGNNALLENLNADYNTAVGANALKVNDNNFNTAIGANSLKSNETGMSNTAVGKSSLESNVGGSYNTVVGVNALASGSASDNVAIGYSAMYLNGSGYQNTALGNSAMLVNYTGSLNTAVGYVAMHSNSTGNDNTASGAAALYYNVSGSNNSAFGREALRDIMTSNNTAVGYHAARETSYGFNNVALGANSLVNNTNGSYHTAIGYNTGPNSANLANTTTLGIDATATATDMVRIGNVYVNSIGGQVGWTTLSDGRFKENVQEDVPGLSFINSLRPVTYQVNRNSVNDFTGVTDRYAGEDKTLALSAVRTSLSEKTSGFIAQEVEASARSIGYEFSGIDAPDNENDYYGLRYGDFVVPLVKAVQELSATNEQLQKQIDELKEMNQDLQLKINRLLED